MKLIYIPLGFSMVLEDKRVNSLVIENTGEFEKYIININDQIMGKVESFYTDEEKSTFFKRCKLITSPFDIQIVDREIQKAFYQEIMEEIEMSCLSEKLTSLHGELIACIEELNLLSDCELDYDEEFNLNTMLKSINVRMEKVEGSFVERFIEYANVMNRLLGKDCYVICNCDAYIDNKEYSFLEQWAKYNSIILLFIRNAQILLPENRNEYIIDNDLCELH